MTNSLVKLSLNLIFSISFFVKTISACAVDGVYCYNNGVSCCSGYCVDSYCYEYSDYNYYYDDWWVWTLSVIGTILCCCLIIMMMRRRRQRQMEMEAMMMSGGGGYNQGYGQPGVVVVNQGYAY